jgi:hypothetical protein
MEIVATIFSMNSDWPYDFVVVLATNIANEIIGYDSAYLVLPSDN